MYRSYDINQMEKALALYPDADNKDVDLQEWLDSPYNVMLVEGDNTGLATYEYPGLYTVHIFCTARGKEALDVGERMVSEMFTRYGAKALRGLTRTENKKVAWFWRKLGAKFLEEVDTSTGPHSLSILSREDFYNKEQGAFEWAA